MSRRSRLDADHEPIDEDATPPRDTRVDRSRGFETETLFAESSNQSGLITRPDIIP